MTFINYASREINCKIVYYGPGLCGKTTNLQWIYDKTNPNAKGKLISLATETDRTLFFDFLPIDLGTIRGMRARIHMPIASAATRFTPPASTSAQGSDMPERVAQIAAPATIAIHAATTNIVTTIDAIRI